MKYGILVAAVVVLAGCGGGDGGTKENGGAPPPNTVAGCTAATVENIVSGAIANTDGPDDPACQGLSEADVMKAGADAFADPKVKAYMADLIEQGGAVPRPSPAGSAPMP